MPFNANGEYIVSPTAGRSGNAGIAQLGGLWHGLVSGASSVGSGTLGAIQGLAENNGYEGVAEWADNNATYLENVAAEHSPISFNGDRSLTNLDYLTSAGGIWSDAGSALGSSLPSTIGGIAFGAAGGALAGSAAGGVGALPGVLLGAVGGALGGVGEDIANTGSLYRDNKRAGLTASDSWNRAKDHAIEGLLPSLGSGALSGALPFVGGAAGKLGISAAERILPKGFAGAMASEGGGTVASVARKAIGLTGSTAGILGDAYMEGITEMMQNAVQNRYTYGSGKEDERWYDPSTWHKDSYEAFDQAFGGSALLGFAGLGAGKVFNSIHTNPNTQQEGHSVQEVLTNHNTQPIYDNPTYNNNEDASQENFVPMEVEPMFDNGIKALEETEENLPINEWLSTVDTSNAILNSSVASNETPSGATIDDFVEEENRIKRDAEDIQQARDERKARWDSEEFLDDDDRDVRNVYDTITSNNNKYIGEDTVELQTAIGKQYVNDLSNMLVKQATENSIHTDENPNPFGEDIVIPNNISLKQNRFDVQDHIENDAELNDNSNQYLRLKRAISEKYQSEGTHPDSVKRIVRQLDKMAEERAKRNVLENNQQVYTEKVNRLKRDLDDAGIGIKKEKAEVILSKLLNGDARPYIREANKLENIKNEKRQVAEVSNKHVNRILNDNSTEPRTYDNTATEILGIKENDLGSGVVDTNTKQNLNTLRVAMEATADTSKELGLTRKKDIKNTLESVLNNMQAPKNMIGQKHINEATKQIYHRIENLDKIPNGDVNRIYDDAKPSTTVQNVEAPKTEAPKQIKLPKGYLDALAFFENVHKELNNPSFDLNKVDGLYEKLKTLESGFPEVEKQLSKHENATGLLKTLRTTQKTVQGYIKHIESKNKKLLEKKEQEAKQRKENSVQKTVSENPVQNESVNTEEKIVSEENVSKESASKKVEQKKRVKKAVPKAKVEEKQTNATTNVVEEGDKILKKNIAKEKTKTPKAIEKDTIKALGDTTVLEEQKDVSVLATEYALMLPDNMKSFKEFFTSIAKEQTKEYTPKEYVALSKQRTEELVKAIKDSDIKDVKDNVGLIHAKNMVLIAYKMFGTEASIKVAKAFKVPNDFKTTDKAISPYQASIKTQLSKEPEYALGYMSDALVEKIATADSKSIHVGNSWLLLPLDITNGFDAYRNFVFSSYKIITPANKTTAKRVLTEATVKHFNNLEKEYEGTIVHGVPASKQYVVQRNLQQLVKNGIIKSEEMVEEIEDVSKVLAKRLYTLQKAIKESSYVDKDNANIKTILEKPIEEKTTVVKYDLNAKRTRDGKTIAIKVPIKRNVDGKEVLANTILNVKADGNTGYYLLDTTELKDSLGNTLSKEEYMNIVMDNIPCYPLASQSTENNVTFAPSLNFLTEQKYNGYINTKAKKEEIAHIIRNAISKSENGLYEVHASMSNIDPSNLAVLYEVANENDIGIAHKDNVLIFSSQKEDMMQLFQGSVMSNKPSSANEEIALTTPSKNKIDVEIYNKLKKDKNLSVAEVMGENENLQSIGEMFHKQGILNYITTLKDEDILGTKTYRELSHDKDLLTYVKSLYLATMSNVYDMYRVGHPEVSFDNFMRNHVVAHDDTLSDGSRGSVRFAKDLKSSLLTLAPTADVSTLMHETAHRYLEFMRYAIDKGFADKQTQNDIKTILKWSGEKDYNSVEFSEKFARGFERFLATGKVESNVWKRLFKQFSKWFSRIYNRLADTTAQLPPSMEGIYTRMISLDKSVDFSDTRENTSMDGIKGPSRALADRRPTISDNMKKTMLESMGIIEIDKVGKIPVYTRKSNAFKLFVSKYIRSPHITFRRLAKKLGKPEIEKFFSFTSRVQDSFRRQKIESIEKLQNMYKDHNIKNKTEDFHEFNSLLDMTKQRGRDAVQPIVLKRPSVFDLAGDKKVDTTYVNLHYNDIYMENLEVDNSQELKEYYESIGYKVHIINEEDDIRLIGTLREEPLVVYKSIREAREAAYRELPKVLSDLGYSNNVSDSFIEYRKYFNDLYDTISENESMLPGLPEESRTKLKQGFVAVSHYNYGVYRVENTPKGEVYTIVTSCKNVRDAVNYIKSRNDNRLIVAERVLGDSGNRPKRVPEHELLKARGIQLNILTKGMSDEQIARQFDKLSRFYPNVTILLKSLRKKDVLDAKMLAETVTDGPLLKSMEISPYKLSQELSAINFFEYIRENGPDIRLTDIKKQFVESYGVGVKSKHAITSKNAEGYSEDFVKSSYKYTDEIYETLTKQHILHEGTKLWNNTFGKNWRDYEYGADSGNLSTEERIMMNTILHVVGKDSSINRSINDFFNSIPYLGSFLRKRLGDDWFTLLGSTGTQLGSLSVFGFYHVANAVQQLSQLVNLFAKVSAKDFSVSVAKASTLSTKYIVNKKSIPKKYDTLFRALNIDRHDIEGFSNEFFSQYGGIETWRIKNVEIGRKLNSTMRLFQEAEIYTRRATAIAFYDKAIKEGKSVNEAIDEARVRVKEICGGYSDRDSAGMFEVGGILGKMMMQYKKYPQKQLEFMYYCIRKPKEAFKFFLGWTLIAGISGAFPEDLFGKINAILKALTGKDMIDGIMEDIKKNPTNAKYWAVVLKGAPSLLGVDFSQKVGMSDLNPFPTPNGVETAGALVSKINRAIIASSQGDNFKEKSLGVARALFPQVGNIYQYSIGSRYDWKTHQVGKKYTESQKLARLAGFTPVSESLDKEYSYRLMQEKYRNMDERKALFNKLQKNPFDKNVKYELIRKFGETSSSIDAELKRLGTKNNTSSIERQLNGIPTKKGGFSNENLKNTANAYSRFSQAIDKL